MLKKIIPTRYRHYSEYILLRFMRLILLCMPVDVASYLMGKTWRIIAPFNKRHQRAIRHMEWALGDEVTPIGREKIARAMWENIGRTFCEGLISDRILKNALSLIARLFGIGMKNVTMALSCLHTILEIGN